MQGHGPVRFPVSPSVLSVYLISIRECWLVMCQYTERDRPCKSTVPSEEVRRSRCPGGTQLRLTRLPHHAMFSPRVRIASEREETNRMTQTRWRITPALLLSTLLVGASRAEEPVPRACGQ